MSMTPYLATWAVLAVIVLGMAIYRNLLGMHDPVLDISPAGAGQVTGHAKQCRAEDWIERWGQLLTIFVILYGFVLLDIYAYKVLVHGSGLVR
jgi:hypothetical protein